ncbi:FitA-like ribbon-helix-helix domain-containing protein [Kiritimatiella glycovorans]|uniref:Antitoxin FitA-like ribbon-helix-helix domain-containing protein n=1 Tax=Kiritimatiella glycovorans TaxID=1307763 RepID=A0A0G3EKD4_9BACT|nr:hypothetical protein [Kiritimatiella glycovorans]AKJ65280.1 hypothetical protein L21SP4_02047 [Kiritimatiella glycovorans]
MKKRHKIQYTIRDVPPEVDRRLRAQAVREGRSLNYVAVEALSASAGVGEEPIEHHDLDAVSGSWVEDPAFDEALKAFEQIDEDLWR